MTKEEQGSAAERLNAHLEAAQLAPLDGISAGRFVEYLSLFVRWNERTNLSSIRDEDGILSRHFVESIACARALPEGILTLLDFGSGGGFPGIPIALCRPEIEVTLAESQGKKAAFLNEAVRVLGLAATVHAQRAELLSARFDCVVLRAVDEMAAAVESAVTLVVDGGWLALMTTGGDWSRLQEAAGTEISWAPGIALPGGENRLLALGRRGVSSPV